MSDTTEKPPLGTPESAAWFRAQLQELEMGYGTFAKLLKRKGDDRQPATILRQIERMASGDARVTGEMRVILHLMLNAKRRGERRTAAALREAVEVLAQ